MASSKIADNSFSSASCKYPFLQSLRANVAYLK